MRIGICDNDKKWCECAKSIISKHIERINMTVEVVIFNDRDTLLKYTGEPLVALFLGIDLGEDSGIELATLVNHKWERCQIIYLTNNLNHATDVYNTSHVFFGLKEHFKDKVGEIFSRIIEGVECRRVKIVLSLVGGEIISLFPEEILYFERDKRKTKIATVWGEFTTWDKLDQLMELLPELFFVRCHNSYIVYLPAVLKMDKQSFCMNSGVKISISRGHCKEVEQAFIRWARTQK